MSEATALVNGIAEKLGNGADRLLTDVEKVATEFVKRVDTLAPQIAAEIKSIGLYAWQCLVRQQVAEGVFYTIAGLSLPFLLYLWYKKIVGKCFDKDGQYYDPIDGGVTVISVIGTIAIIIGSGFFLFYGITHLYSPEYYAVEEIIEKIVKLQNPQR